MCIRDRTLGIRPEDVIISDCEEDGVLGTVTEQYYGGDRWVIKVETEKTMMTAFNPAPVPVSYTHLDVYKRQAFPAGLT